MRVSREGVRRLGAGEAAKPACSAARESVQTADRSVALPVNYD